MINLSINNRFFPLLRIVLVLLAALFSILSLRLALTTNADYMRLLSYLSAKRSAEGNPRPVGEVPSDSLRPVYADNILHIYSAEYDAVLATLVTSQLQGVQRDWLAWLSIIRLVDSRSVSEAASFWPFISPDVQTNMLAMQRKLAIDMEASMQLDKAAQVLKAQILFQPNNVLPYEDLSQFYRRQGQAEEAIAVFELSDIPTEDWVVAYLAGRAAELRGEWPQAVTEYRRATQSSSSDVWALYRLAFVLGIRTGDVTSAIPYCVEATQQYPSNYACYELLGILYENLQEEQKATVWYQAGLEHVQRPSYRSMFWRRIGNIARVEERLDDASYAYTSAIAENPNEVGAFLGLAQLFFVQGNLAEAVQHQAQAIQLESAKGNKIPGLWYKELGMFYEQQGDKVQAIAAYRSALAADPDDADIQVQLETLMAGSQ